MSEELFEFLSLKKNNESKVIYNHNTNTNSDANILIYVSGNWYDEFKVEEIIRLAVQYPNAKIIISGGSGRLTLPEVKEMGGEPMYLFKCLVERAKQEYENLSSIKERCVLCNSSIVTTHNVKFLMYYLSQCADIEGWNTIASTATSRLSKKKYKIFVIDESFLLRRLKATLLQQIEISTNVKKDFPIDMLHSIEFVCSNSQSSADMTNNHLGGKAVAAYLQIGEFKRLINYSNGKEQNLFTRKQAGLISDEVNNLMKVVEQLEDTFIEELDAFLSCSSLNELQTAIMPRF